MLLGIWVALCAATFAVLARPESLLSLEVGPELLVAVLLVDLAIGAGQQLSLVASCPAGKKAVGGTASTSSQPLAFRWLGPVAGNDFLATAKNVGTAPDTLYVSAICLTVAG